MVLAVYDGLPNASWPIFALLYEPLELRHLMRRDRQRRLLAGAVGRSLDLRGLRASDPKGLDRECLARLSIKDRDAAHGRPGNTRVAARQTDHNVARSSSGKSYRASHIVSSPDCAGTQADRRYAHDAPYDCGVRTIGIV